MRIGTIVIVAGLAALSAVSVAAQDKAAGPVHRLDVVFANPGGQALKLDFVRPAGDGPFPLVVLVHSGGWREGARTEFREHQPALAKLGLASAAVDFRLAPAHRFPAAVDDVVAALKYLASEQKSLRIDTDRIALLGTSSGAHLALMAGLRPGDGYQVRMIVSISGPTDLRTLAGGAAPLVKDLLGTVDGQAAIVAEASPITRIRKGGPTVLTAHGTADPMVPLRQVEAFHAALKAAGVKETLIKIEGGGHEFQNWPNLSDTLQTIAGHVVDALQPAAKEDNALVREAPRVLRPADTNVGRLVPDLAFIDIDGTPGKLSDFRSKKYLVVAFTDVGCPLCLKYAPALGRLEREYGDRGVGFLFVYPNAADSPASIRKTVAARKYAGRSVHDRSGELAAAVQAGSTTEVFVLDAARTLVYRGAVDDQYGFGYALDRPRERYLASALDRLLDGRQPVVAATTAPGCDLALEPGPPRDLTYHGRIERILQANCVECHRADGVAPFALDGYDEVTARRDVIRRVVSRSIMPPWFAAKPAAGEHSPWANDRSLSADDRRDLLAWMAGDLKRGNPADAPLPRRYPSGWLIGQPDQVFPLPAAFDVKAEGTMPYREADVPTSFDEDRWVQALEVLPTDASVVHHCLVFVKPPNGKLDATGAFLAIYVPGSSALVYPDGFAKKIPRGATLHFQMHYTPNGTATKDQTRLGVIFAKQPPRHEVQVVSLVNTTFTIPPGAGNHEVEAITPALPGGVRILSFMPHMHLRGKAARYELIRTNGERQVLLDVPRYDFNWQLFYRFAEPVRVPVGSRVRYVGWYDNSDKNPANPDPKQAVTWGNQTYDEMHLGYVEIYQE
ncbi:MAG: alpha/beta hydrolase fold domain-containing protein [Isosphaeraceae bacterium]|nr:alpha/beta hydrolase fold domain-containing protein [Isosphaeraceae bacterium]